MTPKVTDPHYLQSKHISNSKGVRPSCGDCHIPQANWFVETYTHVSSGIRDVIAEMTTDFKDQKAWDARRAVLAKGVRDHMRAQDNATCKSCHVVASIKPSSPAGQAVHTALPLVACVDCHQIWSTSPPPPSPREEGMDMIRAATSASDAQSRRGDLRVNVRAVERSAENGPRHPRRESLRS
jgi:hypothetical protein